MDAARLAEIRIRREQIRQEAEIREARRFAQARRDSLTRAMDERVFEALMK